MLIVLSASVYQGFVIVECFLYSYQQVYPPYFEARVAKGQRYVSKIVDYVVSIVAKVIFFFFKYIFQLPSWSNGYLYSLLAY